MRLPVMPPVKPMLAKLVPEIPEGLLYEPKFDGFRCIVFRDGAEVRLESRNSRPLGRYFPEVVDAARAELPERCVVDGEIVVISGEGLDFEALQLRLHPADSRVRLLAGEIPASFIAFDLIALGDDSLVERGFAERRALLEKALAGSKPPLYLAPTTSSIDLARDWFRVFEGAGLDGVIAKPAEVRYVQDQRVMFKIKHERTADCVVAGFRWYKSERVVGSLMLGLYDEQGRLMPVGVAASFTARRRRQLIDELAPYRVAPGDEHPWAWEEGIEHSRGYEVSRWNRDKDMSFESLRPELVAEVAYDYMEGQRFRHVAHFRRWRPDRDPASCTFDQLERPVRFDVRDVLSSGSG